MDNSEFLSQTLLGICPLNVKDLGGGEPAVIGSPVQHRAAMLNAQVRVLWTFQ